MTDPYVLVGDGVEARQVAPPTVADVAAWCGGTVSLDTAGNLGVDLPDGTRAGYGDWVTFDGAVHRVVDPVEFNRAHRPTREGGRR